MLATLLYLSVPVLVYGSILVYSIYCDWEEGYNEWTALCYARLVEDYTKLYDQAVQSQKDFLVKVAKLNSDIALLKAHPISLKYDEPLFLDKLFRCYSKFTSFDLVVLSILLVIIFVLFMILIFVLRNKKIFSS
jgi:hypothetical protein